MNHTRKINKAVSYYSQSNFAGHATIKAILDNVPECCIEKLTADELTALMECINKAHQQGRAAEAEEWGEIVDKDDRED